MKETTPPSTGNLASDMDALSASISRVAGKIQVIAEAKMVDMNSFTVESAMRMVAGTARSMGITIQGNPPFATK